MDEAVNQAEQTVATNQDSLEAQTQRLKIDEDPKDDDDDAFWKKQLNMLLLKRKY